jgi:adenine phosphoribosyltransferase
VEIKRTILILTDGAAGTQRLAEKIAGELRGHSVAIRAAWDFKGTDILPAELCFLGCEQPAPPCFGYIETLLRHINLAGRPCGLFSPDSQEAVRYLANLVQDSELAVEAEPLFAFDENIGAWVRRLVNQIKQNGGNTMEHTFDLDAHIRRVPGFPKPGVLFYDITSILITPQAFQYCIDAMADIYRDAGIEVIAAVEARGFLFAAPFACRMGIPLILIRKKGKLPGKTLKKAYQLEYAQAEIEIQVDDVPKGKRILLLDDLIATGGTLHAARELLTAAGGIVTDVFGVVGLPFLNYNARIGDLTVRTLINYDTE